MNHCLAKLSLKTPPLPPEEAPLVLNAMLGACHEEGLSVLQSHFHAFHPQGMTGIIVLAESHLSVHTYPEHGLMYVDAFTCGEAWPERVVRALATRLGAVVASLEVRAR